MRETKSRRDCHLFRATKERAGYLRSVYPRGYGFMLPPESVYVLHEAGNAFIYGQYVATVMLSQAFMEHILQIHLQNRNATAIARKGLGAIVKYMREREPRHKFVIEKVDAVRRFRNPFTHLRDSDDPDTLMQRVRVTATNPDKVLEDEAKKALAVMYQVAMTRF
jgi:hypothetical protein